MPGQSFPRRLQGGVALSALPREAKGQCLEKAAPSQGSLESWKSSSEQQGRKGSAVDVWAVPACPESISATLEAVESSEQRVWQHPDVAAGTTDLAVLIGGMRGRVRKSILLKEKPLLHGVLPKKGRNPLPRLSVTCAGRRPLLGTMLSLLG